MEKWIEDMTGLSLNEFSFIVTAFSVVVASIAAVPRIREMIGSLLGIILMRMGSTRRAYARWFLEEHGTLVNIVRKTSERLDLKTTYVPLAVLRAGDMDRHEFEDGKRTSAAEIMTNRENNRIIIPGDPGSGKSTLLRAYGSGVLGRRLPRDRDFAKIPIDLREIPFFVSLRNYQWELSQNSGLDLRTYLTNNILTTHANLRSGERFFDRSVREDRCVVMLDGLDEVGDYERIRDRIKDFESSHESARILLTCRVQNFHGFSGDWVPGFAESTFQLAKLRDDEIFRFIERRKADLGPDKTASQFFQDLLSSGTLEEHRYPLVLVISLGMQSLGGYQIPSSIAQFYKEMIEQLLFRGDYRADRKPAGIGRNKFEVDDKYRFLREFALTAASRHDQFEEFEIGYLEAQSKIAASKMARLPAADAEPFVEEIVERSGLLTKVLETDADADVYTFAHRSIHEFFVADELAFRRTPSIDFLIERAHDQLWQQVCIFYCTIDHDNIIEFIERLATHNGPLAGRCLASALTINRDLVRQVVGQLSDSIAEGAAVDSNLAALAAIAQSASDEVRDSGVDALPGVARGLAASPASLAQLSSIGDDRLIELLQKLVGTPSADVAAIVPTLADQVENKAALVSILWRALSMEAVQADDGLALPIVERLLTLIMTGEGLDALQDQAPFQLPWVTDQKRMEAYPFNKGLPLPSNFVTLLTWADRLDATPMRLNSFFTAKNSNEEAWRQVENDRARRDLALRPYTPGRVGFWALLVGAVAVVAWHLARNGFSVMDNRPFWTTLLLTVGLTVSLGVAVTGLQLVTYRLQGRFPWLSSYLIMSTSETFPSNPIVPMVAYGTDAYWSDGEPYWDLDQARMLLTLGPFQAVYLVALRVVLPWADSVVVFIWAFATILVFWLPSTRMFGQDSVLRIHKPNPVIGIYDDPEGKHWVLPSE